MPQERIQPQATSVPPMVYEALHSPGQPLDAPTRAFMEPRLGADLSAVRVHTDALAAASAQAVHARAYTVGQSMVFGPGQFAPRTPVGERLLLHELTHTLQQRGAPSSRSDQPLEVGPTDDRWEAEAKTVAASADSLRISVGSARWGGTTLPLQRQPADTVDVELAPVSPAESDRLRQQGVQLPTVSPQTWAAIGGTPYSTVLPGYSQLGDTCGAASLVTALTIWDREHWNATQPNSRVVTACDLILIELSRHGGESVRRWTDHPAPQVSRTCSADRACIEQAYGALRQQLRGDLQRIRDAGRQPGARIPEIDYQTMGMTLYFLWHEGGRAGLTSGQIEQIQNSIGLGAHDVHASGNIQSFGEIFTHSIITGLQPDQFAQVAWFVNTGAQHVFLLGRLQSGEWFLSDQGPSPAVEFRAPTLANLGNIVQLAATSGSYWLFTGTSAEYINRFGLLPGWTGVKRLGPQTGVETQAQNLVAPGSFLGEVDAGYTTIGDRLTRDAFVARRYSLSDAQAQFSTATGGGGLIVEMPQGVYTLYTTSAVSDANLSQTGLDTADSGGGVLARHIFYHAWLILGTARGRHGTWFSVY